MITITASHLVSYEEARKRINDYFESQKERIDEACELYCFDAEVHEEGIKSLLAEIDAMNRAVQIIYA